MKIILKKNIQSLGKEDEIINVSDGYAKNYLIPKNLAIYATKNNIKKINELKKKSIEKENLKLLESKKLIENLKNKSIIIKAKTKDENKLFGTITTKIISSELEKQLNIKINKKNIYIKDNINKIGKYPILLKIYKNIKITIIAIIQK